MSFHDLCHTFATRLLGKGIREKPVQELQRTSTTAATPNTYSNVLPGMGEGLAGTMDEALG